MPRLERVEPVEILLCEDNPGDVDLIKKALQRGEVAHRMTVVEDGVEALAVLRRADGYTDCPRPDLILLDLNLPKKDGREVLSEIKTDPQLRLIPVVVLSSSDAETDILKAYELHANSYITKPVDIHQFVRVVRSINDFWFSVVKLPKTAQRMPRLQAGRAQ
jgi:chemotaxis family two-component system response regulator Rcp1